MTTTTTINAGDSPKTITLHESKALTLSGIAGAVGVAYQLDQVLGGTNSVKSWAIGSGALQPIGPFAGVQQFRIECSAGSVTAIMGDAVPAVAAAAAAAMSAAASSSLPIPYASIGDSLADCCNSGTHDMTKVTTALNTKGLLSSRVGFNVPFLSYGRIRLVANCGISGQTTTQLIARDASASSTSRRAITDAADCGARVASVSIGVNDILFGINASTSQSAIDTLVTGTIYPNIMIALKRIYSMGMWPIYRSLGGYGPGTFATTNSFSQADINAQVSVMRRVTAYVRDVIIPSLGFGSYCDIRATCVDESTGAWLPGMSYDGLHEGQAGSLFVSTAIASAIFAWAGISSAAPKYALTGSKVVTGNTFQWPAFTTSASGEVTGFTSTANGGIGTNSLVKSIVDYDGTLNQVYDVTPLTLDGTTGTSVFGVVINFAITGATPLVTFAAGDLFGLEIDLVIESPSGGAPTAVAATVTQLALFYNAGSSSLTFFEQEDNTQNVSGKQNALMPIKGKIVTKPMPAPDTSTNMPYARFFLNTHANALTPYRVRIANVRAVKLSTERA